MTTISHVDSAHRRLFLLMTFLKHYLQNVHIITQHKTVKILNEQHTKSILSAACAPWRHAGKTPGFPFNAFSCSHPNLSLPAGLPEQYHSLTWFLSPVLGLIFTPLIGSASDRCTLPWGRRRPFILALCVGTLMGVALFLNGSLIGKSYLIFYEDSNLNWFYPALFYPKLVLHNFLNN